MYVYGMHTLLVVIFSTACVKPIHESRRDGNATHCMIILIAFKIKIEKRRRKKNLNCFESISDVITNLDATETINSSTPVDTRIFQVDASGGAGYPLVMTSSSDFFELQGDDDRTYHNEIIPRVIYSVFNAVTTENFIGKGKQKKIFFIFLLKT